MARQAAVVFTTLFAVCAPLHELPRGSTLAEFVAALTGAGTAVSQDDAAANAAAASISTCVSAHVPPGSRLLVDAARAPAGGPAGTAAERFLLQTLLATHLEVAPLAACLLGTPGAVPESLLKRSGGALLFASSLPRLFAAAAPVAFESGADNPGALFVALLARGAARNFTLGLSSSPDGFNLLHRALSSDKRTADDVTGSLLQPRLPTGYAERLTAVAERLAITAGALEPALANAARAAARRILRRRLVNASAEGHRLLLGRSVASSHVTELSRALSLALLQALADAETTEQETGDGTSAAAGGGGEGGAFPSLGALAAQRDRFGRTPLHVAATQGHARAVPVLAAALAAAFPSSRAVAAVLTSRDAAGYTAADLATALGHADTATALGKAEAAARPKPRQSGDREAEDEVEEWEEEWGRDYTLQPVVSMLPTPLAPEYPVPQGRVVPAAGAINDDGGWSEPAYTSPASRAAVAAAVGDGGCDVAVVAAAEWTAARFVREHFLPERPVLVRGLAAAATATAEDGVAGSDGFDRAAWRREALLAAYGELSVRPAGIPYAAVYGDDDRAMAAATMPLRTFAEGLQLCSPDDAAAPAPALTAAWCGLFTGGNSSAVQVGSSSSGAAANALELSPPPRHHPPYAFKRLRRSSPAGAAAGDAGERALFAATTARPPRFLAEARLPTWPPAQGGGGGGGASEPLLQASQGGGLSVEVFFGGPGSGAPMHHHGDAVNVLMFGRKAWFLQPPAAAEASTVHPADYVTLVLPSQRTGDKAGAAGSGPTLRCVQGAGDVMYVPRGWGHAVLNANTSVGYALELATSFVRY